MSSQRHWPKLALFLCAAFLSAPALAQTTPADAEALSEAARHGDAAKVKALLEKGVDANTKFRYEVTALFFACDRGHLEVVKLLLERGADVNLRDKFYSASPLNWAASPASVEEPTEAHVEIVKLLLSKGAQGADQVLLGAARSGSLAMVKAVLDHGGLKPETLTTALSTAIGAQHEGVAEALRAAGAQPPPQVDAATLATYAGKYHADTGDIEILFADGKLIASPGGQRIPLVATDKVTFQPEGVGGISIKFQVEGETVGGFVLTQGTTQTTYKRVEEKKP